MYLSRLTFQRNEFTRKWITDAYAVHARLSQAWVDRERFLWRRDGTPSGRECLIVQSQYAPDWHAAFPDWPAFCTPAEVKEITLTGIGNGDQLYFRLRANPTKTDPDTKGTPNRPRVGIQDAQEQMAWLRRKLDAETAGVTLEDAVLIDSGLDFWKKSGRRSPLHYAEYEGMIRVVNRGTLLETVRCGVGHSKAFGCGLLSLARA